MNQTRFPLTLVFFVLLLLLPSTLSQVCQRFCGDIPLRYPFGGGPGCGDPRFTKHVACNQRQLTFTTHTGSYPVTNIDYDNEVVYISDPTMSSCFCTQPSKGFSLDWDAPFSFDDSTVFALLDCSLDSSPIYKGAINGNTSNVPQCDNAGTTLCSSLYSCQPISQLNVPISTCCVYAPVDLGPAYQMDLQKVQCKAYTAVYSFSNQETNPEAWKYGVALKYKFNVRNDYPIYCSNCEKSNGACAYTGTYNTFVCNCPSGVNTTTDCYFQNSWNSGVKLAPWIKGKPFLFLISLPASKAQVCFYLRSFFLFNYYSLKSLHPKFFATFFFLPVSKNLTFCYVFNLVCVQEACFSILLYYCCSGLL